MPQASSTSAAKNWLGRYPFLWLGLLCLLVMLPAMIWRPLSGHDVLVHIRWQQAYAESFWTTGAFPRWLPGLNAGLGSPVFFIYPPISHMITALFYPVTPMPDQVQLRLALSATAALLIGCFGTYRWLLGENTSRNAAVIGSAAYMLAPYHIFVDTYMRTAFAETWVFAWIPFVFIGLQKLETRRGFALTSVALAAVGCTHIPTLLIILPAMFAFTIVRGSENIFKTVFIFGLSVVFALTLGGAYFGTALSQTNMIANEILFSVKYPPEYWLLAGDAQLHTPTGKFEIGAHSVITKITLVAIFQLLVIFALVLFARRSKSTGLAINVSVFIVVVTLYTIVMTTPLSLFIWRMDTVMNKIQFPWRIMLLQVLVLPPAAAWAFDAYSQKNAARAKLMAITLILALAGVNIVAHVGTVRSSIQKTTAMAYADRRDAAEYRLGNLDQSLAPFGGSDARVVAMTGSAQTRISGWNSREILLQVDAESPATLAIRQFSYTGWRYRLNKGSWAPAGQLSKTQPIIAITVPAGRSEVELQMPGTNFDRVGWLLSYISLVILLALIFWDGAALKRRFSGPAAVKSDLA